MTMRNVAKVLVRVVGLYAFIKGLLLMPAVVHSFVADYVMLSGEPSPGLDWNLTYQVCLMILYLFGGAAMMRLAVPISQRLIQSADAPMSDDSLFGLFSPRGFRFCLRLIGVYVLIKSFPLICSGLIGGTRYSEAASWPIWEVDWVRLAPGIIVFAFGIHLVRGGGIVMWLVRDRLEPEKPCANETS